MRDKEKIKLTLLNTITEKKLLYNIDTDWNRIKKTEVDNDGTIGSSEEKKEKQIRTSRLYKDLAQLFADQINKNGKYQNKGTYQYIVIHKIKVISFSIANNEENDNNNPTTNSVKDMNTELEDAIPLLLVRSKRNEHTAALIFILFIFFST